MPFSSVLPAAQSSDNLRMGATIPSEPVAAEPDPAGTLLTGRADSKGLEALTEPGVDPGDEMPLPLVAPQPTQTPRSNLGLRKLISLPGWRWPKQATGEHPTGNLAEADLEASRAEEEQAAVRAQLDDAEARRAKLEQALARVETERRDADAAHVAQVTALEAQAADRLEATRRDVETALALLATELEAKAAAQVEAAARAAAETAQQHDAALAAGRAQLDDAEARLLKLEQALVQVETERRDADTAHVAQVAAVEAHAADRLEATRHDTETALALLATELEAHAAAQVAAAARAAAETAQQYDAELAAGRAQLDDAEARREKLGQDLVQVETERRDADTAHVAQVTALEAQAAEQLAAAVRAAQAEAAQMLGETMRQHDVALASVRTDAQVDMARAEDRVTELKQEVADRVEMHAAAHTAAGRALLDDAEARRMKLGQALARVETERRDADTAHVAQVTALEAQAAEQLAAAVREAQAEAAQRLGETMRQHDVALARVRTGAQSDVARAEDRVMELKQEVADRVETHAAAHTAAVRVAAETAQQHDAVLAALETQAAEQLAAAVREAQAEAAQRLGETMRQRDVALARVRGEAQAEVTLAEDRVTELTQEMADRVETQTAAQTATMRATAETAQMLAETMKHHNVALARVRGEAQAEVTLSEDRVTELKQEMADRAEMQAAAHTVAVRAAAETAQQHDAALAAGRALLDDAEARRMKLEQDLVVRVDTVRREADAAQAAQVAVVEAQAAEMAQQHDAVLAPLKMQAAEQLAAAVREAQAEAAQMLGETMRQHDVALARVRTGAQADVALSEDRVTELKQELADRVATHVEMQATAHTAAVRVAAETAQQHEAVLAAQAAEQLTAAVRAAQVEAAQMLGETMRQHDVALARVRTGAQADVALSEDRVTELKQELADRVATHIEMQAAAHTAAVHVAAETAQQHEAALAAVRGQLEDAVARRVKLEQDLVVRVDSVRLNTNPAHAA